MLEFPDGESRFFISGPCGQLQAASMVKSDVSESADLQGVVTVVCHPHSLMGGTMNNKVVHTVARSHRDLGRRVVRFNFRGVEKSEGEYANGIGEVDDLMAVLSWVKLVRPNDRIVLAGFSFGSYVVTRALQQALSLGFDVISLLLIAPAVENYDFDAFTSFDVPLGVVVGDSDEVVDPAAIYHWFDTVATSKQLLTLKGAGHFFHGQLTELRGLVEQLSS
ncbi:MAG: hypothetical protein COA99_15380 [Moraxellaceae bacterium]|nr:MAG: hypothetical protein COA99_15380 [Moraxellaceae bacterium]